VLGDFEWSFQAMTSQSYYADVTGFRVMTSECVSVVPVVRAACMSVLTSLASHAWLSSSASQLRQVRHNRRNASRCLVSVPAGNRDCLRP